MWSTPKNADNHAKQVDAMIGEAFNQILTASQEAGTSEVSWKSTKASTSGDVAARVTRKLASEEKLIAGYSGVRIRMDMDRLSLWSDRGDVSVSDLWSAYARYPHMTRLASFDVLSNAVSDGAASMSWSTDTFAYADAWDDDKQRWVGMHTAEHVVPVRSGLLVNPERIPDTEDDTGGSGTGDDGGTRAGTGREPGEGEKPGDSRERTPDGVDEGDPQSFYAVFDLDPIRCGKDFGAIVENVVNHLGHDVEISVEVRATDDAGFGDSTRRTVSENATNLGAKSSEFE